MTWDSAITGTEDEDSYFSNGSNFNNDAAADWVTDAENGGTQLTNRTPGAANPGQNDSSLPVDLASLNGYSDAGCILLKWVTECEVNNLGFILERKTPDDDVVWRPIADYRTDPGLRGQGSTSQRKLYQYRDRTVETGRVYQYRLKDVDIFGQIRTVAFVNVKARKPKIVLQSPRPNPFNPATYIPLEVGTAEQVRITILDLLGREVSVITDAFYTPGDYTLVWDGRDSNTRPVSSGVYFLTIQENGVLKPDHPKLILLR
ncbi:MAG: T9SS type A sorting domain-containing protein [FCB group bacterium]|nr:T9SS type A sorting domain-containing protein [FCB group bacterium]